MVNVTLRPELQKDSDDPFYGGRFVFEEPAAVEARQVHFDPDRATLEAFGSPFRAEPPSPATLAESLTRVDDEKPHEARGRFSRFLLAFVAVILPLGVSVLFRPALGWSLYRHAALRYHSLPSPLSFFAHDFDRPPAYLKQYIDNAVRQSLLRQFTPRDHALAVDGACIVPKLSTSTAETYPGAEVLLRENMHGGSCWKIPSSHGQVGIRLPHVIHPSSVTVDHVPLEVLGYGGQAPRRMRLWGMLDGDVNAQLYGRPLDHLSEGPPITEGYIFVHLADFEYDIHAAHHIQTFAVEEHVYEKHLHIGVFVIEVLDNWGSEETCLYRVRIHGDLVVE